MLCALCPPTTACACGSPTTPSPPGCSSAARAAASPWTPLSVRPFATAISRLQPIRSPSWLLILQLLFEVDPSTRLTCCLQARMGQTAVLGCPSSRAPFWFLLSIRLAARAYRAAQTVPPGH